MKKLFVLMFVFSLILVGCGGGGGDGGNGVGETGATLTGYVTSFTAALDMEKKSMFAIVKDFFVPSLFAQASGVTVSVGNLSTTTDANGDFTINNIPTGDQIVTFTSGSTSATYSLNDVDTGETFTLNDIQVSSGQVSTEHTGIWTGSVTTSGGTVTQTLTINDNGNEISGTAVSPNTDPTQPDDVTAFTATENGTSVEGTHVSIGGVCTGLEGTFSGTFSGNTLTITTGADTPGTNPGGTCEGGEGESFTVTKL